MVKIKEIVNTVKAEALKYAVAVGLFFAAATSAFAQTPVYTMDSTVQSSATDLLTSLVQTVFTIIPVAIGIVGGLVATLFGLRWLIGFARSNMHG
jgi:hypothetical protein